MKFMPMGPYPVEVGFCVCPKDWAREMRRRGNSEPFPSSIGSVALFKAENGASFMVVSFTEEMKDFTVIERIGVAVHEATHVWQNIVDHISETKPGSEVEACGVQWIAKWLLEQLQAIGWLKLRT